METLFRKGRIATTSPANKKSIYVFEFKQIQNHYKIKPKIKLILFSKNSFKIKMIPSNNQQTNKKSQTGLPTTHHATTTHHTHGTLMGKNSYRFAQPAVPERRPKSKTKKRKTKKNVAHLFFKPERKTCFRICASVLNGFPCKFGDSCRLAHTYNELRAAVRKCRFGSSCRHEKCNFYHTGEDIDDFMTRRTGVDVTQIFKETPQVQAAESDAEDTLPKRALIAEVRSKIPSQVLAKAWAQKKKVCKEKIAVIAGDYDGCGDIATNDSYFKKVLEACCPDRPGVYEKTVGAFEDQIRDIDRNATRVVWVNGSTRQDVDTDSYNRNKKKSQYAAYTQIGSMKITEGSVFTDTERYIKKIKSGKGRIKPKAQWELCKISQCDRPGKHGSGWNNPLLEVRWSDPLKTRMICDQVSKLKTIYPSGFEYHFFDDREDILEALRDEVMSCPFVLKGVKIVLHRFDWCSYVEKGDEKCAAVFWESPTPKPTVSVSSFTRTTIDLNPTTRSIIEAQSNAKGAKVNLLSYLKSLVSGSDKVDSMETGDKTYYPETATALETKMPTDMEMTVDDYDYAASLVQDYE